MNTLSVWSSHFRSQSMACWAPPSPKATHREQSQQQGHERPTEPVNPYPDAIRLWDCGYYRYWQVIHPLTGQMRWFTAEAEARGWLEEPIPGIDQR